MKKVIVVLCIILVSIILFSILTAYKNPLSENPKNPPSSQNNSSSNQNEAKSLSFSLTLPDTLKIGVFADGVVNARDLELSPGGTLLVSSPVMGTIFALPDNDGNGVADETRTLIQGLNGPHGIAFYNGSLFVVSRNNVSRYNWDEQKLEAVLDKKLFDLPSGGGHTNYSIVFNKSGQMFVALGSTCNVCREEDPWRATIIMSDQNGSNPRVYAKGLRNAPFLTFNPETNALWATEMGRDHLGDDVPPDEINIIQDNQDYGWPICYDNKIHDTNFDKNLYARNPCEDTLAPTYKIPAHSAPLGLTFINSVQFPEDWQGDLLVSLHGSWNRSTPTGYKIIRLNVSGNTATNAEDFISGFIPQNATNGGEAQGRPVDVLFDSKGNLYVSDDKANAVYIVSKK